MRLTQFSDFGLRALIFLATRPGKRVTTEQIADAYGLSHAHLQKVVRRLGKLGVVALFRGRDGGIELAQEPKDISVGSVLRALESDSPLVECFDPERDQCAISSACGLKPHLARAERAFYASLDEVTLADVVGRQRSSALRKILGDES